MKYFGLIFVVLLMACSEQQVMVEHTAVPQPTPTITPQPTYPPCTEDAQVLEGRVPDSEVSFGIYLPPCYERDTDRSYPLLVWTAGPPMMDVVDAMMMAGEIRPFLFVITHRSGGQDYEQKITEELLPYIDANFRTLAERPYRSIAGISHGGAIAARAAWRYPESYGRVAVISGGIADGEQEKFAGWITAVSPENYPAILIDVGEDDPIIDLTNNLTEQLDGHKVPCTFQTAPGGHNAGYWSQHLEEYINHS
jgi:putative tributyrin esterase